MGILGLINFIENASNRTNIKDYKGSVMCIDAYSWLHRGIYACSEILAMGGKTDMHIKYCMKYVKMLLDHQIKPILVFDGQHLPAKELTEKKRRESRKQAKARATEFLRLGKKSEARKYFNRCVDVSHKMAVELMNECRQVDVDCIVAPYEADAQMAFLNISGMADYVVTEDSDLTLFGCKKILFKLDLSDNCLEVDSSKLHLTMGCSSEKYSFEKFRYICILSGCDYIDSLPGIGLAKACKFVLKTEQSDMNKALDKIPSYLNMRNLEVTAEYKLNFLRANATFQFMFVYDPRIRKMVRLNEPSDADIELCCNAGTMLDDKTAFQLAIGNLDPFTLQKVANWSPEDIKLTTTTVKRKPFPSIWQTLNYSKYQSPGPKPKLSQGLLKYRKKSVTQVDVAQVTDEVSVVQEALAIEEDLLSTYSHRSSPPNKKQKTANNCLDLDTTTPEKMSFRNPFCLYPSSTDESTKLRPLTQTLSPVKKPVMTTPSPSKTPTKILSPVKRQNTKVAKQKLATTTLVLSRFFKKPVTKPDQETTIRALESDQIEIKEKFLQVKSLYESSVGNALSLYSDDVDPAITECKSDCTPNSNHNSIIELMSDTEADDQNAIKKTMNKSVH